MLRSFRSHKQQKTPAEIINVVIPIRSSTKIRVPTDAPSLDEAISIPLFEGNGKAEHFQEVLFDHRVSMTKEMSSQISSYCAKLVVELNAG